MPSGHAHAPVVDHVQATAYTIPTDGPESDGTLEWDSTTLVLVHAHGGGRTGIGYTYAGPAAAQVVSGHLASVVQGRDATAPAASWAAMQHAVRNLGGPGWSPRRSPRSTSRCGTCTRGCWRFRSTVALGAVHDATPIYGSGGFTSYDDRRLREQLGGWVAAGIPRVKMKVGRHPSDDVERVRAARQAIGEAQLFVDANGAYTRKEALWWAQRFAEFDVGWLEEPVTSDDLAGLRLLRDRGPGGLDIAAGEYGYDLAYFHHMLDAEAVDCLQADVTRCGGFTALLRVAALCDARGIDLSLHCAPQVSAHAGTAVWHLRHLEYFHDHVRIEGMAFDGVLGPEPGGLLRPDRDRPGLGLEVRTSDLERYRVA